VIIVALFVVGGSRRRTESGATTQPTQATAAPTQARQSTEPGATPAPTQIVVPTPAIPLPRGCPQNTVPQVDNPARYGFCTPTGWGAYNDNNSQPLTLIMKPRAGGSPVLQPTDFDRIQILVALNAPAQTQPPDCQGPPNDSIDGLATHHCAATINPDTNPYKASRAEFWQVDLFGGRQFNITALLTDDVDPSDVALMNDVVHAVKPPSSG
jgi:hypothetical protein